MRSQQERKHGRHFCSTGACFSETAIMKRFVTLLLCAGLVVILAGKRIITRVRWGGTVGQAFAMTPVGNGTCIPDLGSMATMNGYRPFPADNPWNTPIDTAPLDPNSAAYISNAIPTAGLHADFGAGKYWNNGAPFGIPYVVVSGTRPRVAINFTAYGDQSDRGPYPIPSDAPIEGGNRASNTGDRHVLVIDRDQKKLYEIFNAWPQANGRWNAASGAVFDLTSNALRPDQWTSADAAGLPIFPGLVRYDEVASGAIRHAIRFTLQNTQQAFIHPATHAAGLKKTDFAPMGARFRLKASFDISKFPPQSKIILQAMKTYGLILADNGSPWYVSGAPDSRWNDDDLSRLKSVKGSNFEVVYSGPIIRGQ
jgi:hypothetical protein